MRVKGEYTDAHYLATDQWPTYHHVDVPDANDTCTQDHFIIDDDQVYAGKHLIFDFWGARKLDDIERMEQALRDCVIQCQATLLHIHLHHFSPNGGISGVAVLAESHISVHTWPERDYAAFDVFMCGTAKPHLAIPILEDAFTPTKIHITTLKRGMADAGHGTDNSSAKKS